MLFSNVNPKVFTLCLMVLYEIWNTWCMINPRMVCDEFAHGKWFVIDLHFGDDLLSGCLTLVGCLHDIFPWGVGDLLTILGTFYVMPTWRFLRREHPT